MAIAQISCRKKISTAVSVPSWVTAVNAAPGSSQPSSAGTIRWWALDEIGRNSVRPWTMPRTMDSRRLNGRGRLAEPPAAGT